MYLFIISVKIVTMKEDKINKAEVIEQIYKNSNLSKKDIIAVTDAFLSILKNSLLEKKSIELRGFGSFNIVYRKGRENARNPLTGEKVSVPDHHTVKFRPGREIKEALKNCDSE